MYRFDMDNVLALKKLTCIQALTQLSATDRARVELALRVAETVHREQLRPTGGAYIHHPLNVVLTVMNTFHIVDADVLCAALLHDTLEDQSENILKEFGDEEDEGRAELTLERLFGHRVARTVHALSNPEVIAPTREAKNVFYKEHVAEAVNKDSTVCVVKLADFYDNAFQIENIPQEKRAHFITKYGPVIRDVWIPLLTDLVPTHPLFPVKAVVLATAQHIYSQHYAV